MAYTHTTSTSAAAWSPDLFTFAPETVLQPAMIFRSTNVAGRIEGDAPSLRVAYADDVDVDFIPEGNAFDESEPDLAEAVVHTKKFGQLVRITREQYSQDGTDQHLAQSVARSMIAKADNALLAQAAPTAPAVAPVAGLVNTTDIETTTDITDSLDPLIDLEATVRANRAVPTLWVVAPDTWAALRKLNIGTDYEQKLLGAGTEDALPRLLSIEVVVNPEVPSNQGLLIDPTAIVSAVSDLTISTSMDYYFNSDAVAVRAHMRTGHAVVHPDRIGLFSISTEA